MIFRDFTIFRGRIHSQRTQNTDALAPEALALCRTLIQRLRQGELSVWHGVEGLPYFSVSFGAPSFLAELGEAVENAGRFFTLSDQFGGEFQVNCVLSPDPAENDSRDVATIFGISLPEIERFKVTEADIERIVASRPALLTTVGTLENSPLMEDVISVAADFSTCFAAALLLEEDSP